MYQPKVANPKTRGQLEHRKRFSMCGKFVKIFGSTPFCVEFPKNLYFCVMENVENILTKIRWCLTKYKALYVSEIYIKECNSKCLKVVEQFF